MSCAHDVFFFPTIGKVTNTEFGTWPCCFGGNAKNFGALARTAVECYKQSLTYHSSRNFDSGSVESHVDSGVAAQEV